MIQIGIDPGLTGAVAVLHAGVVEFFDTPTVQMKVGKSLKTQMDPAACALLLSGITARYRTDCFVTIEKVAPMPSFRGPGGIVDKDKPQSMGVTSAFNFGMGYGIWIGVCAASLLPYQLVHPATWKRRLMADMAKGKDAGRIKAMQLYPFTADRLKLKKHHGRADALLLAHYGKMSFTQQRAAVEETDELQLF